MKTKKPPLVTPLLRSIVPWLQTYKACCETGEYKQVRPLPFDGEQVKKVCDSLSRGGHESDAKALDLVWERVILRWTDWLFAFLFRDTSGKKRDSLIAEYGKFPQPRTDSEWQSVFLAVGRAMVDLVEELMTVRPLLEKVRRQRVRGKAGAEVWRMAQTRLLKLHRQGDLPKTLRQAANLIGEKFNTTRRAAHNSPTLKEWFKLSDAEPPASENLLDELLKQADHRTQKLALDLSPRQRQEAETALKKMPLQRRDELLRTLTRDPDAGWGKHASLIEDADQDTRLAD